VLDANGSGTDSQVIAAIQRLIQLKAPTTFAYQSFAGTRIYESYTLDPVCQALKRPGNPQHRGVVAAGNGGRNNDYGTQGYATIQRR